MFDKMLKANRDEISGRLEQSSNKQATVEQILGSVFSKNEAQKIAKQIKTNGQSDKQITDQMMKHIDNLKTTTSDDIWHPCLIKRLIKRL